MKRTKLITGGVMLKGKWMVKPEKSNNWIITTGKQKKVSTKKTNRQKRSKNYKSTKVRTSIKRRTKQTHAYTR